MQAVKPTRVFSEPQMAAMRQATDPVADEVVRQVYAERGMAGLGQLMAFLGNRKHPAAVTTPAKSDDAMRLPVEQRLKAALAPYALTLDEMPGPEQADAVREYFRQDNALPAWANHPQMLRGAAFFKKYQEHLMMLLGCYSLPYCYAAADGAQVLYLSQRMQKNTYQRLAETGQFVVEVTQPRAFAEGGTGPVICRKVRLMHAVIRHYTLHSGRWNEAWGMPVNQEDMAGTNLALSYIAIRGLRRIGVHPDEAESEDYLHLWNVVGYFLGVGVELLPANLREAYHIDRVIAGRNFKPSEAGTALTRALLESMEKDSPYTLPPNLVANQMRLLLGDTLADMLDIPPYNWTQNLVRTARIRNFFQHLRAS